MEEKRLRRLFTAAGAALGILVTALYQWRAATRPVPDPVWVRFVNTALILFTCIYFANLLRRGCTAARKRLTRFRCKGS